MFSWFEKHGPMSEPCHVCHRVAALHVMADFLQDCAKQLQQITCGQEQFGHIIAAVAIQLHVRNCLS
jgi:hypothetical protein